MQMMRKLPYRCGLLALAMGTLLQGCYQRVQTDETGSESSSPTTDANATQAAGDELDTQKSASADTDAGDPSASSDGASSQSTASVGDSGQQDDSTTLSDTGEVTTGTDTSQDSDPQTESTGADTNSTSGDASDDATTTGSTDDSQDGSSTQDSSGVMCMGDYSCTPPAPSGWSGPVAMLQAADPKTLGQCRGDFPTSPAAGQTGLKGGGHSCSGCTCDPRGKVGISDCPDVEVNFHYVSCNNAPDFSFTLDSRTDTANCNPMNPSGNVYYRATWPNQTVTPTCDAPPDVVADIDPPTWQQYHRACTAKTFDYECNNDEVCVADPDSPFTGRLCIYADGDQNCPSNGVYINRSVLYAGHSDTRSCSPCTCSGSGTLNCRLGVVLFESDDCYAGSKSYVVTNNDCAQVPMGSVPPQSGRSTVNIDGKGNYCQSGGGQTIGQLSTKSPFTVCCN